MAALDTRIGHRHTPARGPGSWDNRVEARRYETLDGLRGVAAIAVVVFHLNGLKLEPNLVPHGYLAVDFFFVLSGFVVAYAYEEALRTSLSLRAFVIKRIIRLYPLAVLGAAIGFALLLLKWRLYPEKVDPLPRIILSGLLNDLMLPTLFGGPVSHYEIFPGNGPLWTLFFEFLINLLWAWRGIRLRSTTLLAVALCSWVVLAVSAVAFHTVNIGFELHSFGAGMARVCFGFPVGVVIYRLRASLRVHAWRGGPAVLGLVLVAVLASPLNADGSGVPWWDLASVLVILPAIVIVGVGQDGAGRIGTLLGALSYPIYVLHAPVLLTVSGLRQSALQGWNIHLLVAAGLVAVILLALTSLRLYDEPVRRYLYAAAIRHNLFRPRYTTVQQAAAIRHDA